MYHADLVDAYINYRLSAVDVEAEEVGREREPTHEMAPSPPSSPPPDSPLGLPGMIADAPGTPAQSARPASPVAANETALATTVPAPPTPRTDAQSPHFRFSFSGFGAVLDRSNLRTSKS